MDAANRAELDALRRRAYAPGGGIHDDPQALARLVELEDLARPTAADPVDDTLETDAEPQTADSVQVPVPSRRWRAARVAVVGGAVVLAAAALAATIWHPADQLLPRAPTSPPSQPTVAAALDPRTAPGGDPGAETLMTISLDAPFTDYADEHFLGAGAPSFPSQTALNWTMSIGRYYGWTIWIAGGGEFPDTEHCILAERQGVVHARCRTRAAKDAGGLFVALSAADIPHPDLPRPMYPDETVRFWWLQNTSVDVVLGRFGLP